MLYWSYIFVYSFKGVLDEGNLTPLDSFLSVIDDVPVDFTVKHFKNEIINLLCLQADDMVKTLKPQLHVAHCSYIELIQRLHQELPMGSGIDFYMGTARQFIGKPVLIIKPTMNPKYSKEKGPRFLFEKLYLYKGDEHMNVADIKIRFVFNGLNYYVPFYQSDVTRLICSGTGTLKNISTVAKDLRKLMEKIPRQASINIGMKQLSLYLDASECIVSQTWLS